MPYLMIDATTAASAASELTLAGSGIETVQAHVVAAASLAELDTASLDLLAGLEELLYTTGRQLLHAADAVTRFRLPAIAALPTTPWNEVRQLASHNSYAHPGAIDDLYDSGIRTFELDVHRGAPTDVAFRDQTFSSWLRRVSADAIDHRSDRADDWRVYHHSLDSASAYRWFSDGLATIAELPPTDPITVFVDNKDSFADGHSPAVFDALLEGYLGSRLYRPRDMLARSPGATTLSEAVDRDGWPTVAELQGRVVVVLTDEVAEYHLLPIDEQAAFVAGRPASSGEASRSNVVFYNASGSRVTADAIDKLRESGGVVRVWNGGPEHDNANYLAVDDIGR